MKRRLFRVQGLAAMAAVAWVLLAAGRTAAQEIELWTTEVEPTRLSTIEYLTKAFTVLGAGVQVRVVGVDENELVDRFIAAAADGKAPAVVDADSNLLAVLAGRGLLDAAAATRLVGDLGARRFFDGPMKALTTADGSGQYAVPFHGWVQAIWYRADWFHEARLPPPTDWETILQAARHFTDPAGGRYGILIGTAPDLYAEQVFTQFARSNGVTALDRASAEAYGSPAMIDTLTYYKSLAAFGPPGPRNRKSRDLFFTGRLAMIFYSSFFIGNLALPPEAQPGAGTGQGPVVDRLIGKTDMVPVFTNAAPGTYGVVDGLAVGRQADPQATAAAQSLIAFLMRPDAYVEWLHMAPGGMLPVVRDVVGSQAFIRDPQGVFRRFGWNRIQSLVATFDTFNVLGAVGPEVLVRRARVTDARIVPQMIQKVLAGEAPATAAAWAAAEVAKLE